MAHYNRSLPSSDPGVSSALDDLFSVLAKNNGCHANLHGRFLPSAVQLLDSNEMGLPPGLVAVSVEVERVVKSVLCVGCAGCAGATGEGVP